MARKDRLEVDVSASEQCSAKVIQMRFCVLCGEKRAITQDKIRKSHELEARKTYPVDGTRYCLLSNSTFPSSSAAN